MRSLSVRLWQGPARQSSISLGSAKTGGKGIRTPDLLIANETLYQLSYTPKALNISTLSAEICLRFSVLHTDLLHCRLGLHESTTGEQERISESRRMSLPIFKRSLLC